MIKKKIGVYLCQCGSNIAGKVDVARIAEEIGRNSEEVAVCRYYKYICSEPGQKLIRDDIAELGLDYVVEASCSPKMHEPTFRNAVATAGMNPYMFEMVNIREHCSWVSEDMEAATHKAQDLVQGGIKRVLQHSPLVGTRKPVIPAALVLGGGIAGITAALKIANAGYQVYLVEKDEIIGGRMAQFDKTFPTLDCAGCTLTPKTSEAGRHPHIEILTLARVEALSGFVGNFTVSVRQQPRYVSLDKCTGCGDCQPVCPVSFSSAFEEGLGTRHPISRPFPQAIPNTYSILREGQPPCETACPADVNVCGYMHLAGLGKFREALALVRERMPFAAICGRICFHPCETACKRGQLDQPLAICHTKRYLGDYELAQGIFEHPPLAPDRQQKVGIVGSGPAGLSAAYYLRLKGYEVTVFEKLPVVGGMLAVGIPAYRLPRAILQAEIDNLRGMGIEIRTGVTFGRDVTFEQLEAEGYQAFFVAIGLHHNTPLRIPGEELDGVIPGTDFLRRAALEEAMQLGSRVVVIGGGNVAIDCARTAWRSGVAEVTLLYRRTREEMPAWDIEVDEAEKEGIRLQFLAAPVRLLESGSQVTGLEYLQMELGEPDDSGRRRPLPIPGSETVLPADTIIPAIGQAPDLPGLQALALDTSKWGLTITDPQTLATSRPGVFAGGDCSLGAASFVEAVAQGRHAAESMHHYLQHGGLRPLEAPEPAMDGTLTHAERARAIPLPRQLMPHLPLAQRRGTFAEVDLGFSAAMAQTEGQRCLACSLCAQCGECERNCGPQAINLKETARLRQLEVGAVVVATGIEVFDATRYPEYGYGRYPDVITNLQFERLCNASGPTSGKVLCPSDGRVPQSIVFVQCVGSRDPARGNAYCSKVCCMISAKQLSIFKHHNPDGQAYVFYIDNRTGGKGYEEFLRRVIEQDGAQYIRGRVARVYQEAGRLVVRGENSLVGGIVEVEADMVVLATGLTAPKGVADVARVLNLSTDKDGFFIEAHPKLGPVETALSGIFLAGGAQGPKDIPESVAQGGATGAEVLALFSRGEVEVEPTIALISERYCTGCKTCMGLCPYTAVSFSEERKLAAINEALCQGCGTCAAACPVAAIRVQHYTPEQMYAQIEGIMGG